MFFVCLLVCCLFCFIINTLGIEVAVYEILNSKKMKMNKYYLLLTLVTGDVTDTYVFQIMF